jgi:mannan endo-1,6-alpha-mannosidase
MSALEVVQSNLVHTVQGPLSISTGGTSKGDPRFVLLQGSFDQCIMVANSAGTGNALVLMNTLPTIRVRDRIGAGIATVIVIGNLLGGAW